jgi:predicted transcriptional regulator of viral defense system
MGKTVHKKDVMALFHKSPILDSKSIYRIVGEKSQGKTDYARQLIKNLIDSGKIRKITKGFYSIHEDPSLAVYALKPAYLGLQDALSHHNLWEQETIPVIITTKRVRQGIRKIGETNILVRKIDKKYMFGFETTKQGEIYLPISDIEKTTIDMIYFREKIEKQTLDEIKTKINQKKLITYLKFYPQKIQKTILNRLSA